MKKLILGFILAIGAMITFSACSSENGSPSDVTKAFYEAAIQKDFKKAMDYCCKKDGKLLTQEEKDQLAGLFQLKVNNPEQKDALKDMPAKISNIEEKIAEITKELVYRVEWA